MNDTEIILIDNITIYNTFIITILITLVFFVLYMYKVDSRKLNDKIDIKDYEIKLKSDNIKLLEEQIINRNGISEKYNNLLVKYNDMENEYFNLKDQYNELLKNR